MTQQLWVYSTLECEPAVFAATNKPEYDLEFKFINEHLSEDNLPPAGAAKAISLFVTDSAPAPILKKLKEAGVEVVLCRSKGFEYVDLAAADELGIAVLNTDYEMHAVIEHTILLTLALARKLPGTLKNEEKGDLIPTSEIGIALHGKVAGVVGTGKIGEGVLQILRAIGMSIIAYDAYPNRALEASKAVTYVDSVETLLSLSDIVTLHCPLTAESTHMMNAERIALMKKGALLINTARGGLIDTKAALDALEAGQLGGLAVDVYENERPYFFFKHQRPLDDAVLERLLTHPKVIITPHSSYVSESTIANLVGNCLVRLDQFLRGDKPQGLLGRVQAAKAKEAEPAANEPRTVYTPVV